MAETSKTTMSAQVQRCEEFYVRLDLQPRPRGEELAQRVAQAVADDIGSSVFYDERPTTGTVEVGGKTYHYTISVELTDDSNDYDEWTLE